MKAADRWLQNLRFSQILPYLSRGSSLLDIGCADGALAAKMPHLSRYVGVDPDAPLFSDSKSARFLRGTFPGVELDDDAPFDAVSALAVLEHVKTDELPTFAAALARVLRPGGVLLMTVPHPLVDAILHILMALRVLDGMETEQHHGFDPNTAPALFEAHGFRLVRHERFELGLNHLFVFERRELPR